MKKRTLLCTVLLGCIFLVGCTREEEYPTDNTPQQLVEPNADALSILSIYADGNFEIPEQEAIEMAKAAISDPLLNPAARTRAEVPLIKNVRPLTSDSLRTKILYPTGTGKKLVVTLPKVLGYAVNFVDNVQKDAGFVIIPADKRIGYTILATVPSGCLPATDEEEVTNDGVAFFLDNAEEYAIWRIAEAERKADSLKSALVAEYQPLYPDNQIEVEFDDTEVDSETRLSVKLRLFVRVTTTVERDWWDVTSVAPLVPVEWGQGYPFNDLVKDKKKCGDVVTGCVATAAVQLMAYWKYPPLVNGEWMDWENMVKYTGQAAWRFWEGKSGNKWLGTMLDNASPEIRWKTAHLMKYMGESIGAKYHCGTDGCKQCGGGGTSADVFNVVDRLNKMGYHMRARSGYSFNKIKTALQAGRPILTRGYSGRVKHKFLGIKIYTSYTGGHAWIVDGYKERQRTLKSVVTVKSGRIVLSTKTTYRTETDNLIYNNWGWDGLSNGYFTAGVFDSNNRILVPDGASTRGTDYYYKYKIELWYNSYR